jgi:hypothetical protein
MIREIWKDQEGNLYEVEWGSLDDYCFFRPYPNTTRSRMRRGFLMVDRIIEEGWSYVETLSQED